MILTAALFVFSSIDAGPHERLPPTIELSGFQGTEARSLDDFLGQALLVDFFAHWCEPCAREVAHLNQLHEELGPRGLNVIGVTGDDAETARTWLGKLKARYPHALDSELKLQIELGFRPLPFAVLVDPTGAIVWEGNPAKLERDVIDSAMRGALALPALRWPAEARRVRDALRQGRFDEARAQAKSVAAIGTELAAFVDRAVERQRDLMQAAYDRGDYLTADELAAELAAGAGDGAVTARATEVRERISKDGRALRVKTALLEVRRSWSSVAAIGSKQAAEELAEKLRALAKDHAGTFVETRVEAHLRTLSSFKSLLR